MIGGTLRAGTGSPRRSISSVLSAGCVLKLQGSCTGGLGWREKKEKGQFYVAYRPLSADDTCC